MADVTLPQLGETVTEGTITRWFKKVGDTVAADEPLFEVSTDKVDTEVPSPVAGTVTEIRAARGRHGARRRRHRRRRRCRRLRPLQRLPRRLQLRRAEPGPGAPSPSPSPSPQPAPAPPSPQPRTRRPEPAPRSSAAAGSLLRRQPPSRAEAPQPAPAPRRRAAPRPTTRRRDNRLLSPVVRRLVAEHGINPDDITGTGPGGRITRDDVLDHIDRAGRTAQPQPRRCTCRRTGAGRHPRRAAPAPAAPHRARARTGCAARTAPHARRAAPVVASGERDTSVPLSKIRKLTGSHMVMSKSVSPHAFSVVEVDFANVDATRAKVKGEWKAAEGFSLTYLPFITRAVVDALDEFPHLNASVGDDDLVVHNFVDIGIAVDLDYEGLLVPVVRAAETKRLRAIAREINDLASRARSRKLSPDEICGGTFTISNNGSAGSVLTMAIINQPQVAILSTDAIVRKPVVVKLPDGGEAIVIHPVGNLAMTWDHRAFDGAYAAGFLVKVKEMLETRDWSQSSE